jgi:hypothetical protein
MKANKIIAWLTGILTLSLAVFSFVLSFNALTDLAAQHGVSIPGLFPFLVEFGVVIFSLNALYRSLNGEKAAWQWTLIIGSSLLAGTFNVLHADPDLVSKTMAAMPSLFLLLSFETFLGQLKHAVKRQAVTKNLGQLEQDLEQQRLTFDAKLERMRSTLRLRFDQERSDLRAELEQLATQVETLTVQKAKLKQELSGLEKRKNTWQHDALNGFNQDRLYKKQQALDALLDYYRSNPNASLTEAGQAIKRSKGTVSNYLVELEQAGLVHRNGKGVEVIAK